MLDSHARLKRASVNDGARSPANNNTHTHTVRARCADLVLLSPLYQLPCTHVPFVHHATRPICARVWVWIAVS